MEKSEFIALLSNPVEIDLPQTNRLEEILETYPFFQPAHALRLKGLKQHKSFLYNSALKKTAAHTLDRAILFEWITSENFSQNEVSEEINQQKEESEPAGEPQKNLHEILEMSHREANQVMDPQLFEISKSLQLGKALDFEPSEKHSFSEWLKLTSAKPIVREDQKETIEKQRKSELIDAFISKNPKIHPPEKSHSGNLSAPSKDFSEQLMTQTLARVYLEQKNYKKAIQAYKILILKNPEKSGFFADQIRAIEKLQENNTQ